MALEDNIKKDIIEDIISIFHEHEFCYQYGYYYLEDKDLPKEYTELKEHLFKKLDDIKILLNAF